MSNITQEEIDKQILHIRKLKKRLEEHQQERFKFESLKVNTRKCLALQGIEQCKNHRYEFEELCLFHYTQMPKPKFLGKLNVDDNVEIDNDLIEHVNEQIKQAIEEEELHSVPITAAQAKLTEMMSRRSVELTFDRYLEYQNQKSPTYSPQFTSIIERMYDKHRIVFKPKRCHAWMGDSQCKQKPIKDGTLCVEHLVTETIKVCTTEVIANYNRHLKTKLKETTLGCTS